MTHDHWNLRRPFVLGDGRVVLIRPIETTDVALAADFLRSLGPTTRYMRFMYTCKFCAIDARKWVEFDRERAMGLLAETTSHGYRRGVADVRCVR